MDDSPVKLAETTDAAPAEASQLATVAEAAGEIGHTSQDDRSTTSASVDTDGGTADLAPQNAKG
ncbi:MAG: hypothetical protein ACRDRS_13865 [Pseudonocardiaceae bacterium]